MLVRDYKMQKDSYPSGFDKTKSKGIKTFSSDLTSFSKFNSYSEPLNYNSQKLSFKGSSYKGISEGLKYFEEIFGKTAKNHLEEKINVVSKIKNSGLKVDGDKISFKEKTAVETIKDLLLYPILKLPLDIVVSSLKLLKKIPGLEKSKRIDEWLNSKRLKKHQELNQAVSDTAAIEHYFKMISDGKEKDKIFSAAHGRLKSVVCNYDTTSERTLTRIVTGTIPAFFLAKDAYNLTMYMKDNKKQAEDDKKRRFNQEVTRIGITAGLTYMVLGFFSKKSNDSAAVTTLLMSGATLVAEIVGRVLSGTPVLPVNEHQAKKYEKIQHKKYNKDDSNKKEKRSDNFKGSEGQPIVKKSGLTLKNILKWTGILAVAGLGYDKISNIKSIKAALNDVNKKYKGFLQKDFNITREEFNKLTQKLKDNGFDNLSEKYKEIVKDQKGEEIKLGKVENKTKDILIDKLLAFPVRYSWIVLMTPYNLILKPVIKAFSKTKASAKKEKKEIDILKDSIKYLQKIDKKENYKENVSKSLIASFDNVTKSNYSNANLATVVKNAVSGITSVFLVIDNYNQVMVESAGQNKELAQQKAKERTIQRGIRLAYGAYIIGLFNGMFSSVYNSSLVGAQAVNVGNTFLVESLERKSVGLPTRKATREEIIDAEQKNLSAGGIKGRYFRLMAKLTGKKSLSAQAVIKEKKENK